MNARSEVAGKVAVVTGASRGLGAGLVEAFLDAGMRVAACARTDPPAGDVRASVDVADGPAVHAFCHEVAGGLGPIDLWVSNAGVLEPITPAREVDPAAFRRTVDVNLLGTLHGAQAYVAHRRAVGGGGTLVNITSGAALKGYAGWAAYCASKAGVDRLSEVLALEEAEIGLRVHAVAPGIVDTAMQSTIRATPAEVFPLVERFRAIAEDGAFNSPPFVAGHLLDLAFGAPHDRVVLRLPDER